MFFIRDSEGFVRGRDTYLTLDDAFKGFADDVVKDPDYFPWEYPFSIISSTTADVVVTINLPV